MPDHDDKPDTKLEPPGGVPDQLIDPDVEPCGHLNTFDPGADPRLTWCCDCGALCVDGEWRLPGHPAPAT